MKHAVLLNTLLSAGLILLSVSVSAQSRVTVDLNSTRPKYQLHFTDASKIINTKKDVSSISYSGGWFFVAYKSDYDYSGASTTIDIYDAEGTLYFSDQDPGYWSPVMSRQRFFVNNDLIMVSGGQICNIREKRIVGRVEDYNALSHIVDGVGMVRREAEQDGVTYQLYDFFTETGKSLSDMILFYSRYTYDLKDPSPLKDGRRATYIQEIEKWGYLDEKGALAIPFDYDGAHDFSEGLAAVQKEVDGEYKWGFINPQGEEVIPFKFTKEPDDFHDGFAIVRKLNGKRTFVKKDGSTVNMEEDELFPRWNDHVIMCELNPTFTYFMTPTKDIIFKDLNSTRWGYDTDCPIPFITGDWGTPVISYEGELLYRRQPGMYLEDGFWWDNKYTGYSAVLFNTEGEVLLAFKTVKEEF